MSAPAEAAIRAAKGCQEAADALMGGAGETCHESRRAFAAYMSAYSALREAQRACAELTDALGLKEAL